MRSNSAGFLSETPRRARGDGFLAVGNPTIAFLGYGSLENGILQTIRVAALSSTAAKNDSTGVMFTVRTFTANPNEPPSAASIESCETKWPCLVNSTYSLGRCGLGLITSLFET